MRFVRESVLPASVEEVFAFHERPDAFALLQPPWERVEILVPPVGLEVGTRVEQGQLEDDARADAQPFPVVVDDHRNG